MFIYLLFILFQIQPTWITVIQHFEKDYKYRRFILFIFLVGRKLELLPFGTIVFTLLLVIIAS